MRAGYSQQSATVQALETSDFQHDFFQRPKLWDGSEQTSFINANGETPSHSVDEPFNGWDFELSMKAFGQKGRGLLKILKGLVRYQQKLEMKDYAEFEWKDLTLGDWYPSQLAYPEKEKEESCD